MDTLKLSQKGTTATVDDVEPMAIDAGLGHHTQQTPTLQLSMPDLSDDRRKTAKMAKTHLQKGQYYFKNPMEYAQHRYGLILPSKLFCFNHDTKIKWWLYLGKHLQQEKFANMDSLSNALDCLMQGHSEHIEQLFDIYVRRRELINDNRIIIQRFPQAIFRTIEGDSTRNLYLLRFPHSRKEDWVIGVSSAANVVLALRENWASHRTDVVRNFLKYDF